MTLHQSRLTNLLTTFIFVFAVAAVLAYVWDTAEPKDIVGATAAYAAYAAYAAVLVVFVGTANTTDGTGVPGGGINTNGLSNGAVAGVVVGALAGATLFLWVFVTILALFGPGRALHHVWRTRIFPHTGGKSSA